MAVDFIFVVSAWGTFMFHAMVRSAWVAVVMAFAAGNATSQDNPAGKSIVPTESHKQLHSLVGKWDLIIKSPAGPGGKTSETKGTAMYKSILGGLFVQEEAKTKLFGQPFEWVGTYGFDTYRSKFIAAWADSWNTIIENAEGDADLGGKTVTLIGETVKPGGAKEKFHWVVTFPVEGKLTIEMFAVNKGGSRGMRMMEVTGTKAQ